MTSGKEAHIGSLPVETVDLIIDALIGCGLRGAPVGPTQTLITWANSNGAPVISLEIPTGIQAENGQIEGSL
jgi:NAD(P)H-hydrate epimerase